MAQKYKSAAYIVLAILAILPVVASAADMPSIFPTGFWGPILSCTGNQQGSSIPTSLGRTCTNEDDIIQTFLNVISVGMSLGIFILAPLFFAWGGIQILIAGGSPGELDKGKKILTGTVIGIVIILASYLIIKLFVSALGIAGIGGFS